MSHSITSSISSDDDHHHYEKHRNRSQNHRGEDQSISSSSLRPQPTRQRQNRRSLQNRYSPLLSSSNKNNRTPKTPAMEALTSKYEFLMAEADQALEEDYPHHHQQTQQQQQQQQQHQEKKPRGVDSPPGFYRTPPPSSSRFDNQNFETASLRSYGSQQSSHTNTTPTKRISRPSLSAQKILNRLHNTGGGASEGKLPRSIPRFPVLDQPASSNSNKKDSQYRHDLKQNLEHRLRMIDDEQQPDDTASRGSSSKKQDGKNEVESKRRTPPRISSAKQHRYRQQAPGFRNSFGSPASFMKDEVSPLQKPKSKKQQRIASRSLGDLPSSPPSSDHPRFIVSSTTTSTTMAMSESGHPPCSTRSLIADRENRETAQPQEQPILHPAESTEHDDIISDICSLDQDPHHNNYTKKDVMALGTSTVNGSDSQVVVDEDGASFWHRWKMAEKRMQQQQEQFEKEKLEWVRQLESAYNANTQVEALAKRMELQLVAVHNSCLQQVTGSDEDDLDNDENSLNHYEPKEEPIDPLHLLMLKESGTVPENVEDLVRDNSSDDDHTSRSGGIDSFENMERLERRMTRTKTKNVILSHLVKLLERQAQEQKLDLEQQLKQEKEERLEVEKMLNKQEQEQQSQRNDRTAPRSPAPTESEQQKALQHRLWMREQQYEQERKEYDAKLQKLQTEIEQYKQQQSHHNASSSKKELAGDKKVESLLAQLKTLKTEKKELEKRCNSLQTKCNNLEKKQESSRTTHLHFRDSEEQLRQMQTTVKDLERQLEKSEAKHARERQEWEWQLSQQEHPSAAAATTGSVTSNMIERLEKQREAERSRLLSQLEEAQEKNADITAENDELVAQVQTLRQQVSESQKNSAGSGSLNDRLVGFGMKQLEKKHEQEKQDWSQQLDALRDECDRKNQQISNLESMLDTANATSPNERNTPAHVSQFEDEMAKLESLLEEERAKVEASEAEITRLNGTIEDLQKKAIASVDNPMQVIDKFDPTAWVDKEAFEALTSQYQEATAELERYMTSLDEESKKCREVMEKNVDLELKIEQLTRHRHDSSETEIGTTQGSQPDTNTESKKANDLKEQLREKESELLSARDALKLSNTKCRQLEESITELTEDVERLVSERQESYSRIEALLSQQSRDQTNFEEKSSALVGEIQMLTSQLEEVKSYTTQLEDRNDSLNGELQQLNVKFITEMKDLQQSYQATRTEENTIYSELKEKTQSLEMGLRAAKSELEGKEKLLQEERQRHDAVLEEIKCVNSHLQEELGGNVSQHNLAEQIQTYKANKAEITSSLEAEVVKLRQEVESSSSELKFSNRKIEQLERRVEDFVKEKKEWESQLQNLNSCESMESVRTQELIEEKAERERQLEEAKRELEIGLKALRDESEKYRKVVEKNAQLDIQNRKLLVEKDGWERSIRSASDEKARTEQMMATRIADLQEQLTSLQKSHEAALIDLRSASANNIAEVRDLKQRQDDLLSEKITLNAQLAAAEREIETIQKHHEASKRDWEQQVRRSGEEAAQSCRNAVEELKQDVLNMGEQIVVSNQAIKELATKQSLEEEVLSGFSRIRQEMETTVMKLAEESHLKNWDQNIILRRLDEIKQASNVTPEHQFDLSEHFLLLQELRDICLKSKAATDDGIEVKFSSDSGCGKQERFDEFHEQDGAMLVLLRKQLQKASDDLQDEKTKRREAEKQAKELHDKLSNRRVSFSLDGPSDDSLNVDLDLQLAQIAEKIDGEMEQIHSICKVSSGLPKETDESSGARQAMVAQSMTLVKSIREMAAAKDVEEEEELASDCFQHLEILSELIGQVELIDSAAETGDEAEMQCKANPAQPTEDGVEMQLEGKPMPQTSDGIEMEFDVNQAASQERGSETDLLRYELAQNDSMLDLLDDTYDQASMHSHPVGCVNVVPDLTTPSGRSFKTANDEASPIELVVEQTYNRCQALERERCDLINVTLDLLSASREANKAEIDAALASARRKAAEEMIAMKKETEAQVNEIWYRLCERCKHRLTTSSGQ